MPDSKASTAAPRSFLMRLGRKLSSQLSALYKGKDKATPSDVPSSGSPASTPSFRVDESVLFPGDPAPEACILVTSKMTQEELEIDA